MRGLSLVAASMGHSSSRGAGLFTVAASLVAGHRLQTRRLSSCGSQAQLLRGMWDLPRPGLEPVSPALAGRLSTTVPPGKPYFFFFFLSFFFFDADHFFFLNLFILFLAALDLHCRMRAFSSGGERELLFVAVHGLPTAVASLVVEHGL